MESIIQKDKTKCFICQENPCGDPLDKHHVFFGALRSKSERYGLTVYIHHDKCHLNGVHKYGGLDLLLKRAVQKRAMEHYGWSVEDFRKEFYKNYL